MESISSSRRSPTKSLSSASSQDISKNSNTTKIDGNYYILIETAADGNCGADACQKLLEQANVSFISNVDLSKLRKAICKIVKATLVFNSIHHDPTRLSYSTIQEYLPQAFKSPAIFLSLATKSLENTINDQQESLKGKDKEASDNILQEIEIKRQFINKINQFESLPNKWKDFEVKNLFEFNRTIFTNMVMHLLFIDDVTHIFNPHWIPINKENILSTIDEYYNKVSSSKSWFTNTELICFLRYYGFRFEGYKLELCTQVKGLILEFTNSNGESFYLHSNATMNEQGFQEASAGTHWQPLQKSAGKQEAKTSLVVPPNHSCKHKRLIEPSTNDFTLFPRCEYFPRFNGTTYFQMDPEDSDPTVKNYYKTYHRSKFSRFSDKEGYGTVTYESKLCRKRKRGEDEGYFSHTGGYSNPFGFENYSKKIKRQSSLELNDKPLYDNLLEYKNKMCQEVVKAYNPKGYAITDAHHNNRYPCIIVKLSWNARVPRPVHYDSLIMSYFVGIVNYNAYQANIPIELVMRSSFGHNIPSVDKTDGSFRINIGLIPKKYAVLLGTSLRQLNWIFEKLPTLAKAEVSLEFRQKRKEYFDKKENKRKEKSTTNPGKKPKRIINDGTYKSIWATLFCRASANGTKYIDEMFREQINAELLSNFVYKELIKDKKAFFTTHAAEAPIVRIWEFLDIETTVTFKEKAQAEFHTNHLKKLKFKKEESTTLEQDNEFWQIAEDIATGLMVKGEFLQRGKKVYGLYNFLEWANTNFITQYYSDDVEEQDGVGSDSEHEAEITSSPNSNEETVKTKIYLKKIIVPTGMMAVNLAYIAASEFLKNRSPIVDYEYMYYEVQDCLKYAMYPPQTVNSKRNNGDKVNILFFDLNYFLANKATQSPFHKLAAKIRNTQPEVVVLDYASATSKDIYAKVKWLFTQSHHINGVWGPTLGQRIKLVLLINSGLKNEAAGSDINPYGTLQIVALDKNIRDKLYNSLCATLNKEKLTPAKSHQIRRAYKRRGFTLTSRHIFPNHLIIDKRHD
jgi:hypothetical protein